jgi:hypothetical protein
MAAARYWRLVAVETRGYRADLVLTEIALYEGAVRVDTTPTATIAPSSGALSALSDGSTAASVTFAGADVAMPGFGIVWDLGSAKAVAEMRITPGTAADNFVYSASLQSSADGITWASEIDVFALAYPGNLTPAVTVYGDNGYSTTGLLLNFNGANGSTSIVDSSPNNLSPLTLTGVTISTAQSKFGGASGKATAAGALDYDTSTAFASAGDWTLEFFIRMSSLPAAIVYFMGPNSTRYHTLGTTGILQAAGFANGNAAPMQLALNTWHHVAYTHTANDTIMQFFDGVMVATSAIDHGGTPTAADTFGVFNLPGRADLPPFSDGYIDSLRYSRSARYLSDFTPPAAQFPANAPNAYSARKISLGGTQYGAAIGYPSGGTVPRLLGEGMEERRDIEDFGFYRVPGTVKEKSTPSNLPLRRRVQLYHQRSGRMIREMWSDAATGAYSFDYIRGDAVYFVVSFDHLQNYRAVIADNITPELIPS